MWTPIIVALIAGVFGLASIWFQHRVHRDNRNDHAQVTEALDNLTSHVRDVHDDVKDVRRTLHHHAARLLHLEHKDEP